MVGTTNRSINCTFATSTRARARGAGGQALPGDHRNCGRRERRLRHDQRGQEDRRPRKHPAFAAACRCPQVGGSQTRAEEVRRPHKPRGQGTRGLLPAGDPYHRGWSAARRVCSTACSTKTVASYSTATEILCERAEPEFRCRTCASGSRTANNGVHQLSLRARKI